MRHTQPVHSVSEQKYGGDQRTDTHPAFGVAVVSRPVSTGTTLFQSDLQHKEFIRLTIGHAERVRSLNSDRVHETGQVIEVDMSLAQWGSLISSIGIGSGVPVTIRRTTEGATPDLPYEPRIAENLAEVRNSVKAALSEVDDSLEFLEEVIESKGGIRAVRDALRTHKAKVANAPANAEFAVKQAAKAAEKITHQAKTDIESHVLNAIQLTSQNSPIALPDLGTQLSEIEAAGE